MSSLALCLLWAIPAQAPASMDLSRAVVVTRPGKLPAAEAVASVVLVEEVAKRTGKTTEQVIAAHLASPFKVYVLGFMPGLAYVAGLDQALFLPRRSQPRVRVPRSSVAIAMDMTTIYPFESPGGWHLIGRTPLWMFDKRREQPVFLSPGDSLSFERIDRRSFDRIAGEVEAGTFDWSSLVKSK